MAFKSEVVAILKRPFDPENVQFRIGRFPKVNPGEGGKARTTALAYIDARDVMDRLDEAFGVGGWSCEHKIFYSPQGKCANVCTITIDGPLDDGYCFVADCAEETQIEGIKGASSDAFKRAAVKLGIFRYAYDLGETWCDVIYKNGFWYIPPEEMARMRASLPRPGDDQKHPIINLDSKKNELLTILKSRLSESDYSQLLGRIRDQYGKWADLEEIDKLKLLEELGRGVENAKV